MPGIKQKDQGYKPKSWVMNKEVRFWGFVIVVTAAPATFAKMDPMRLKVLMKSK
jgi:hypothetical protein